jgi:hypothetical protein
LTVFFDKAQTENVYVEIKIGRDPAGYRRHVMDTAHVQWPLKNTPVTTLHPFRTGFEPCAFHNFRGRQYPSSRVDPRQPYGLSKSDLLFSKLRQRHAIGRQGATSEPVGTQNCRDRFLFTSSGRP